MARNEILKERWRLTVCMAVSAGLFIALAVYWTRFHAFWSPDSGAKFAILRNWVEHGRIVPLDYPFEAVDPAGRIHSLAGVYIAHAPGGLAIIYAPLFPLLCAPFYRLLGFGGLTVVPLLSGLGVLLFSYGMAARLRLRSRFALLVALSFATPLVLYAAVFWEHASLMCVTAAVGWLLLRAEQEQRPRDAALAGATLGFGVWLHGMMALLWVALMVAAIPLMRDGGQRRLVGALVVGFLPMLAAWVLSNVLLYGSPAGAHLTGTMHAAEAAYANSAGGAAYFVAKALDSLFGFPALGAIVTPFVLLLLLLPATSRATSILRYLGLGCLLYIARLAYIALSHMDIATGLFQATPLLALAACAPALHAPQEAERRNEAAFYGWIGGASLIFMPLMILSPGFAGLNWGSRLLLTVLPWMAVRAAAAAERWIGQERGAARWTAALGTAALVAVGVFSQYRGFLSIRADLVYSRDLNQAVSAVSSPAIVFSPLWIGPELAPSPRVDRALYLSGLPDDTHYLVRALTRDDVAEFTYFGDAPTQDALAREAARGPLPYRPADTRQACGMQIVRFVRATHAVRTTAVKERG